MDEIKDIQATNFSKFLETDVRTNPFGENRSGERAYRRAERLSAGIFLLTNHIPASDALRNQVRSSAVSLLDATMGLRNEMRSANSIAVVQFQSVVRQLISQIRMLVFAGFVSPQNAEVVSGALDELGNFVVLSQRSHFSESVRMSKEEFLDVRESSKGHIKDIKDRQYIKDKLLIKDGQNPEAGSQKSAQSGMDPRAASIVDILRGGGELTIRDIAANLPEYGEKTIQRELSDLIRQGLVARIGRRRWSRYQLVR